MKLLISGSQGQVGSEVLRLAQKNNIETVAYSRQQLDITDKKAVFSAVTMQQPDFIINCSAYTAVDKAESESETAFTINEIGAANLADIAAQQHCTLIHISTDYVFDGALKRPYTEQDTPAPINIYGLSKWKGELAIRSHCPEHIILRTSAVFGVQGHNIVKTICRLATEKDTIRMVADQYTCPTAAFDIAAAIFAIITQLYNEKSLHTQHHRYGTYHYCGTDITSWYDFANVLLDIARQYQALKIQSIEPISAADYLTPAKRPLYSALDCDKIYKLFGITQASWVESLKIVLAALLQ